MSFRGFLAQHRTASGLIAPGIVGVAALIAVPWAMSGGQSTVDTKLMSSVTECHDMVTVSVAGRTDTPVAGTTKMLVDANGKALPAALSSDYSSKWVDPVVNAPNAAAKPGSYAAVYIAYPANMDTYEKAVDAGVSNAETVMRQIKASCPNTKFSIVGYSEGADVARRVAMDVGHQTADANGQYGIVNPANVLGVVILADNGRVAGQGPFPGAKDPNSNPDGFGTKYQNGTTPASGHGAMTDTGGDDFGALNGKIASFCSDGDLTCSAPQNISLLQLAANVGRQINADSLQKNGLTPATGQDVAVVLGRIAMNAFGEITSTPNWMASKQTFLDVLLKVSAPSYKPGETTPTTPVAAPADSISATQISPLAYLPAKVFNEIVGLIATNQNTIPVVMNDPYSLTLAPGTGHHFDYWHDANAADGKPLSSAQYAAAWLTYLAQQAQNGKPVDPAAQPDAASLASALSAAQSAAASATAVPSAAPTAAPTAAAVAAAVTATATPTTSAAPPTADIAGSSDATASAQPTVDAASGSPVSDAAVTTTAAPTPTTSTPTVTPTVTPTPTG